MAQKSLKKNALLSFIKCFMNIIFPIISFPYASRILMPEGIGKVNLANSIIEYFLMIAGLGISTYAAREAAKIRDDTKRLNKFAREMFLLNMISSAVSYILLAAAILCVPKFSEYRILLIICSTKILFTTAGITWLFIATEDYAYITIRSILFQFLSLVFLFTFVRDSGDYYQYAAMGVFSNVGANVLNIFHSRKYVRLFRKTGIDLKKHLKPVTVFFGIDCAGKIHSALDAVMLGFILGDAAVGYYTASYKLEKMVNELITAVVSSFMPRSSYYVEHGKLDEYRRIVSNVLGVAFFFSLPAGAGLFMLCRPLILLFSGERYLPAVNAMRILSAGTVFWCANSFLLNCIIVPNRKEKFTLISQITTAVFNIIFNTIFIKPLGVAGAALGTLIVQIMGPCILLVPSFRYLNSLSNLAEILKALCGTAVMAAAVHLLCARIENTLGQILLSVTVGCLTYAAAELLLRSRTAAMILSAVTKKLRKCGRRKRP